MEIVFERFEGGTSYDVKGQNTSCLEVIGPKRASQIFLSIITRRDRLSTSASIKIYEIRLRKIWGGTRYDAKGQKTSFLEVIRPKRASQTFLSIITRRDRLSTSASMKIYEIRLLKIWGGDPLRRQMSNNVVFRGYWAESGELNIFEHNN